MKQKGFTLVELLGVIVLLAGLLTLVSYSIVSVVKNTNQNLDESSLKVLYSASEMYLKNDKNLVNGDYTVTVNDLIRADIIKETFLDAQSEKLITRDSCIKVNITNGKFNYEFKYVCE